MRAVATGNGPRLISRPLLGGRRTVAAFVVTGLFLKRDSFKVGSRLGDPSFRKG